MKTKLLLSVCLALSVILLGCRGSTTGNQRPSDVERLERQRIDNMTTEWMMMPHIDRMMHGYADVDGDKKLGDTLPINTILHPGNSITSKNKQYSLVFEKSGDLYLMRTKDNKIIWAGTTGNEPASFLVFHSDNNVVLYSRSGRAIWTTDTHDSGATELKVTDNGSMVLLADGKVVWAVNKQGWKIIKQDK